MSDQQRVIQIVVDSKNAEPAIKQLTKEVDRLNTKLTGIKSKGKAANDSVGKFGRSSGQAGIQISQFVGQIQGGQNAMVALSQQSADLGFVLGAPLLGAVVGITASLAGMLLPALFATNDALKDVSETSETLASNFLQLTGAQQGVARSAITQEIKKQQKAIDGLNKDLIKANKTLEDRERHIAGGGLELKFFSREKARDEITAIESSIIVAELGIKKLQKTLFSLGSNPLKPIQADLDKIGAGLTKFDSSRFQAAANPYQVNIDAVTQNRNEALFAINEAERKALENTMLTEDQKSAIISEATFNRVSLEILANQEKNAAILRDDDLFNQAKINAAGSVGSSLMSLAQNQSKGLFKIGKALSLASAIASLPNAVIQSYENNGGYPWGIPAALAMAATGLANINQIKNTKFGSTSAGAATAGGGAVSSPAANDSSFAPPTQTQITERKSQNDILNELRKWNGSAFVPIEVARGIAESLVLVEQQGGI